jgi:hypothetical protein
LLDDGFTCQLTTRWWKGLFTGLGVDPNCRLVDGNRGKSFPFGEKGNSTFTSVVMIDYPRLDGASQRIAHIRCKRLKRRSNAGDFKLRLWFVLVSCVQLLM